MGGKRDHGESWLVRHYGRAWRGAGALGEDKNPDGNTRPTILLYDQIGEDWFGDGLSAKAIIELLDSFADAPEVDVRVNSPGGLVFEGVAIYNALTRFPGKLIGHIDGSALSIATLIVMACDEIRMADNAMFMVHSPWGFTMGNAADHRGQAEILDKIESQMLNTYAARTGRTRADLQKLLAAETWMTADEALAEGFVDVVSASKKVAGFDLSPFGYVNIPKTLRTARSPIPSALHPGAGPLEHLEAPAPRPTDTRGRQALAAPAPGADAWADVPIVTAAEAATFPTLTEAVADQCGPEAARQREEDRSQRALLARQRRARAAVRMLEKEIGPLD